MTSSPETQVVFLRGERVFLRPLHPEDANTGYVSWLNDGEICSANSHHVYPYTPQQARQYIAEITDAKNAIVLAIIESSSNGHIGNIALQQIHSINRSAEFAILIGEKAAWSKGYGFEAASLLFSHGFSALNLERIYCGTFATNLSMQRLATKLGMTKVGQSRRAAFKDGSYVDVISYDILHSEWDSVKRS